MNTHTPARWTHKQGGHFQGLICITREGGPRDEALALVVEEADARLIAAAPDLLKALRGLVEAVGFAASMGLDTKKYINPEEAFIAISKAVEG